MDPSTRHRRHTGRAEGESQRQTSMGSGEGQPTSHGKSEAQDQVVNEAAEIVRFARDYDVILYGATGFVGNLCAKYLAKAWTEQAADRGEASDAAVSANDARKPGPFRWAIAGKDRAKLIELRESLAEIHAPFKDLDYFVADSDSRESIEAMVRRAQVVLAAAGPFAELAPPVIEACVQLGTHYVDITGELDFMQDVVRKYHDAAAHRGVHIVQACGFVSVPFDLSVLQLHLAAEGAGSRLGMVEAFAKSKTTIGGGSAVSLMRLFDQPKERVARAFHPFSLNPPENQPPITLDDVGPYLPRLRLSERSMALPFFPLGSVDMRVVRRSAALLDYGPRFHYQERMQTSWVVGLFLWFLMAVTQILLLIPAARRIIEKIRPPGSGPSEKLMREGFLDLKVEAKTEDGKMISTRFQCGEPGYKETATMMCESALCLALEQDKLVHTKGGVLTPATSMGMHLVKRLRKAGFGITEPTIRD